MNMLSRSIRSVLSLRYAYNSIRCFPMFSRSLSSNTSGIEENSINPIDTNSNSQSLSKEEPIPLDIAAKQVSALEDNSNPITMNEQSSSESSNSSTKTNSGKLTAWFDFMDTREVPYGNWNTFEPDQIFSSLEFDLYGKNCEEIYKYEKDDLYVDFDILKRTKLPKMIEPPSVKDENGQKYLNDICFELNRNPYYTYEEKVKLVNFLKNVIDGESLMDKLRNK